MRKYLLLLYIILGSLFSQGQLLKQITVNGAVINYVDTGRGEPIVFVHGSLEDYTTWLPQIERFSKQYRIIAYSRRYNYPNHNSAPDSSFSPVKEAADLGALIQTLHLGAVHLVGHSFGGITALTLAVQQPRLVRSLTLSEPATLEWLPDLPNGQTLLDDFNKRLWQPVRASFIAKDSSGVLRHTFRYFAGEDLVDQLPPEVINQLKQSLGEWHSIAFSLNGFKGVPMEAVTKIKMPVLILTAGNTLPILDPLNKELVRLLPEATHFHVADATHDFWVTHPDKLGTAVYNFLARSTTK